LPDQLLGPAQAGEGFRHIGAGTQLLLLQAQGGLVFKPHLVEGGFGLLEALFPVVKLDSRDRVPLFNRSSTRRDGTVLPLKRISREISTASIMRACTDMTGRSPPGLPAISGCSLLPQPTRPVSMYRQRTIKIPSATLTEWFIAGKDAPRNRNIKRIVRRTAQTILNNFQKSLT
jgi:hypothetical protein